MAVKYYGKIKHSKGRYWKLYNVDIHICIKLKSIFPSIPKYKPEPFYLIDNPEICRDLHWFFSRYPFEFENKYEKAWFIDQKDRHIKTLNDLELIYAPDYKPKKIKVKGELRDYQAKAVEILLKRKFLMCGDVVGLGKTYIGIGMFVSKGTLPGIAIVQTHLPKQWQSMIEVFCDLKIHQINGTKPYELPEADIYIMKYSCLLGWTDVFNTGYFKSVCFDEIQNLRRRESQRYISANVLANKAVYKLGLSATPIYNYGDEMWNIMNLLQRDSLGNYHDFIREWTDGYKKVNEPKALGSYLRENFYFIRRTREEVGRELPEINTIIHTVGFDQQAIDDIEELAKTLAIKVCTGSFIERGQSARDLDIMMRQATGVSKARYVAEYVNMLLENEEAVLLVGWHRTVYNIWLDRLRYHEPVMYTGTESPKQKEESKMKFINGETNLMIMSLRSGVGLDGLQLRSNVVVFGELDWSPAIMKEQVPGRLARDGQKKQVTAIYLVSDSGSDPPMLDLLGLKASQAKDIIDPLAPIGKKYSDDSRIKILAKRFLEERGIKLETTKNDS